MGIGGNMIDVSMILSNSAMEEARTLTM